MKILFQLIIVTTQPSPTMCKGRPTHNEGQEISSSNTEVGLINFSAEEWSLDRPEHRTKVATLVLLIILLLLGVYKLRKRCLKRDKGNQATLNSNQPPTLTTIQTSYQTNQPHRHMDTNMARTQTSTLPSQPMKQLNTNMISKQQKSNRSQCHTT